MMGPHWTVPLLLLLLLSFPPGTTAATCIKYDGQLCPHLLNTYVESDDLSISAKESALIVGGFPTLMEVGAAIDPVCADVGYHYICAQYFPACYTTDPDNVTVVVPPCRSLCSGYVKECGDVLTARGAADLIPNCSTSPTSGCYSYAYNPNLPEDFECPAPLIVKPEGDNSSDTCVGVCCVPCPQTHYFLSEGRADILDQIVIVVGLLSFFLAVFITVTYSLMPEKRSYPSTIILCISIALLFLYFPLFSLIGNPNRVRCVNEVTQALPGQNTNQLCLFQSTFLLFGYLSAVFWFFVLVANIYVSVIFLSKRLEDFRFWFQPIGWGLPWIFVIAAQVTKSTGYAFGVSCFVKPGFFLNALTLIPIGFLLFPAVFLNFHVLLKIFMVARKRNASLQAILKLQIRSFFFVTTCLIVLLFFWIFIEVNVNSLTLDPNAEWIQEWYICVATGKGQNECSKISSPHLPDLAPYIVAEVLVYSLGIILFVFFSCKMEVYEFWREVLSGNTKRITHTLSSFSTPDVSQKTQRSTKADEETSMAEVLRKDQDMKSGIKNSSAMRLNSPDAHE